MFSCIEVSVAMLDFLITHINGNENPTHFFTKVLCSEKERFLGKSNILYDVLNDEFKLY